MRQPALQYQYEPIIGTPPLSEAAQGIPADQAFFQPELCEPIFPLLHPSSELGSSLFLGELGKINTGVCHGMKIPLPSPSETSYLGHHKSSGLTSAAAAALKHNIDCISHPIHKHRLFRSQASCQTFGPITKRHYSSLAQQRSEDP